MVGGEGPAVLRSRSSRPIGCLARRRLDRRLCRTTNRSDRRPGFGVADRSSGHSQHRRWTRRNRRRSKGGRGIRPDGCKWRFAHSPGKIARLEKLCALFGLDTRRVGNLRYQLLHRTAAAIIEAKRYRTTCAAMLVQSWSRGNDGFCDYVSFFDTLGLPNLVPSRLGGPLDIDGVKLWTGWLSERE